MKLSRKLRLPLVGGAVAAALTLGSSGVAWANGNDAIGLDIQNTSITSTTTDGVSCTYEITSSVTVVNLGSTPLNITAVTASATWSEGSSNGLVNGTIVNNGGLVAGDTIAGNAAVTYQPVVTDVTIPCAATDGDLAIHVTDQYGTGSGDAPFLSSGLPLPITAIGGLTLAGLISVVLVFLQRRHSRNRLTTTI